MFEGLGDMASVLLLFLVHTQGVSKHIPTIG